MPTDPVHYGTVAVQVGRPPSRNGAPTLTFQMPTDLARAWPDWATHVYVTVDDSGVHLRPVHVVQTVAPTVLPFDG